MEGFCSMLRAGCKQMQKYVPYKQLLGLNYFKNLWVLVNDSFNRKFSQNTFTDILGTRKKKKERIGINMELFKYTGKLFPKSPP